MQFKHPELLWGLLLLLIPIFIHLFQLRRFQKTPFTNVKFLKKVISESRRSSTLKKWLLLFTRMLLLSGLVVAFTQPFFAEKSALKQKEMVIYLDDSFSMQAQADGASLLNNAVQALIKALPKEEKFSLFTNTEAYRNVALSEVQNSLLGLQATAQQLQLEEVFLKSKTFFSKDESTLKNLVVISDFQERFTGTQQDSALTFQPYLVQLHSESGKNVTLDTVYLADTQENLELKVLLQNIGELESLPVSLFNGEALIAKTAAVFDDNDKAEISFSLPKDEVIKGKVEISDIGLSYDNQLYFSINKKDKIKVLAIGDDTTFLSRIYTADEFDFRSTSLKNLAYSIFTEQNLIVLNELPSIPNAMLSSIKSFTDAGGKFVFIPAKNGDISSYNSLTNNYFRTSYHRRIDDDRKITNINFAHPLYKNVFEKKVTNFQYPKVNSYFPSTTNAPALLSFQDKEPFLLGGDTSFFFMAPFSGQSSNFKNSPLIVPTFYNMGKNSLKLPALYSVVGQTTTVDIVAQLENDRILKTVKEGYEFIPQQQAFSNRVSLNFAESPTNDGIFEIKDGDTLLQYISFNYERKESELRYRKPQMGEASFETDSIASLFESLEKDNSITELWKWFVTLALLFLLVEILIQKYL